MTATTERTDALTALADSVRAAMTPIQNAVHILMLSRDGECVRVARDIIGRQFAHLSDLADKLVAAAHGGGEEPVPEACLADEGAGVPEVDRNDGPSQGGPSPIRQLLVIGDTRAAEELARRFSAEGHYVRTAEDGLGVSRLARSFRPEVVFVDAEAPGVVWQRIVSGLPDGPDVVVMTEGAASQVRSPGTRAVRHLAKPVEPSRLADLLRRLDFDASPEPSRDEDGTPRYPAAVPTAAQLLPILNGRI